MTWLRLIAQQLGYPPTLPKTINEDTQSCIAWAFGDRSGKGSRHIALKLRYAKDVAEKGEISAQRCPTDQMLADILTTPGARGCRARANGAFFPSPPRGGIFKRYIDAI